MKQEEEPITGLPENAFRELKPGEVYNPLMSPDKKYSEVNAWSVTWGILMAILFSAAAAYLGLKVGQVFEAAIPIAIIAVGVSGAAKRKNALGENVIIQSIGASSGVIVAGAIFTLPALYILQETYPKEITVTFAQVFISSLLGGVLGILFLIPFRKYFVSDMHGKYPFPEATATTQVLVSGEKGGSQAKPLLMAGIIGGLYDFIVATFGWWNENFTTRVCGFGEMLAEKAKLVFKVNTGAAVLGLGYIVGLKYASIICAGSLAVWWIIIPGMSMIWGDSVLNQWNPEITATIGAMAPEEIFKYYAKSIGIGGIAMAGIIGIIKSWGIIKSAVGLAAKEMGGKSNVEASVKRTQRDISMKIIAIGSIITLLLVVLFFYFDVMQGNLTHTIVAILLVAGIAFLFTTVAANAIAIVGTNPVSGMTLMTLILASVVMVAVGLKGPEGMVAALVMGGVVCTALSMAGGFITDLKIGYWLEVPRNHRFCRYRRWCNDYPKQDIRFHQRTAGRSASQCHGGRYRTVDERCGCALAALRHRCSAGRHPQLLQDSRTGICIGYVHPIGTECSVGSGRCHQLVRDQPQQGCRSQCRTRGERYPACLRFHCRRCIDGRGKCCHAFRRNQPRKRCMVAEHLVRSAGAGCLCHSDILPHQSFHENQITFKYQEHEKDSTFIFSICSDHVICTKAR